MRAAMTGQLTLFHAPPPVAGREVLKLRDYQEAAIEAIMTAAAAGTRRQLVSMPTGSGKTIVFATLISRLGRPAVVLVHRDELVTQTAAKLQTVAPHLSVGVVKAERDDLAADVVIASAQTLAHERRLGRLVAATRGRPLLMVSDECHHDASPTRRRALFALDPELLVGVTATPKRGDGAGLSGIYDAIVYHVDLLDLMRRELLAPLVGLRIDSAVDLDAVHTVAGEFNEGELADAINTPARNRLIVEAHGRHAQGRRRTVAFCVDVAHATDLAAAFRAAGTPCAVITGATPAADRAAVYAAFRGGSLPVVSNCMVLTEGWDEPAVDCILMARPTKSQSLYVQIVGRGARLSPETDKQTCLVIDFVDATSRHKLVTLPTLAGDPNAAGRPDSDSDPRRDGEQIDLLDYADRGKPLRERAAVEVNLYGQSAYVWGELAGVRYAPAGRSTYLVMEQDGAGYHPLLLQAPGYGAPWMLTPLAVTPMPDLGYAMAIAEQAAEPFAQLAGYAVGRGGWRDQRVAPTDRQIEAALRAGLDPSAYTTKGEISAALDQVYFHRAYRRARRRYDTQ